MSINYIFKPKCFTEKIVSKNIDIFLIYLFVLYYIIILYLVYSKKFEFHHRLQFPVIVTR